MYPGRRALSAAWLVGALAACQRAPAPEPTGAGPSHDAGAVSGDTLWGSAWTLEDIAGAGVIDDAQATLEFPAAGKVAGRGSCNRYFGTVEVTGDHIRFGPLGATRMACAEAVMDQETRYLKQLEAARRFAVEGDVLRIYAAESSPSLRFTRQSR